MDKRTLGHHTFPPFFLPDGCCLHACAAAKRDRTDGTGHVCGQDGWCKPFPPATKNGWQQQLAAGGEKAMKQALNSLQAGRQLAASSFSRAAQQPSISRQPPSVCLCLHAHTCLALACMEGGGEDPLPFTPPAFGTCFIAAALMTPHFACIFDSIDGRRAAAISPYQSGDMAAFFVLCHFAQLLYSRAHIVHISL